MPVKVTIRPNGPDLVEGDIELVDVNGNKVDTSARGPRIALCRCGASVTKPFCDGTHRTIGLHAPEAPAARRPTGRVAGDARSAAQVDAGRGQDAAGARAPPEPLVERPAVSD